MGEHRAAASFLKSNVNEDMLQDVGFAGLISQAAHMHHGYSKNAALDFQKLDTETQHTKINLKNSGHRVIKHLCRRASVQCTNKDISDYHNYASINISPFNMDGNMLNIQSCLACKQPEDKLSSQFVKVHFPGPLSEEEMDMDTEKSLELPPPLVICSCPAR